MMTEALITFRDCDAEVSVSSKSYSF